jgi:hypothetical protein
MGVELMKNRLASINEIPLLLGILLVFSLSVSLLYGARVDPNKFDLLTPEQTPNQKEEQVALPQVQGSIELPALPVPPEPRPLTLPDQSEHPLSKNVPEHAKEALSIAALSQGVETMAAILKGLPVNDVQAIAKLVIEEKSSLTRDDKLEFLYALLSNYPNDTQAQNQILDLIGEFKLLREGRAPLLIAVKSAHFKKLPAIIQWATTFTANNKQVPDEISQLIQQGMDQAVDEDDPSALQAMFANGVTATQDQLSELLWHAVAGDRNTAFVKLLVDKGADINYAADDKYSPLMKAVEDKNGPLVQEIIKVGGDKLKINMMYDVGVGTALQIANEKGLAHIDQMLRDAGAREDIHLRSSKIKLKKSL